jgi:hypothetical protein
MKKVIDADNQVCLEQFDEKATGEVKAKYELSGEWDDISVDASGDIILWEEL